MSFFCGCEDSEYELAYEVHGPYTGHKTIRCPECRGEIAPGHEVREGVYVLTGDAPFDDLDEDTQDALLADPETHYRTIVCASCAELEDAFSDTGMCWYRGDFHESYLDWLAEQGLPPRTPLSRVIRAPRQIGRIVPPSPK